MCKKTLKIKCLPVDSDLDHLETAVMSLARRDRGVRGGEWSYVYEDCRGVIQDVAKYK